MSKKRVLFLCTGNSCRSQMAEACLRHLADNRFEVYSAGTQPSGMNRMAVETMREIGIDISQQRSKTLDGFLDQRFDRVITVCDRAKESCPVFPGSVSRLHWSFEDPADATGSLDEQRAVFRRVRNEIMERVQLFVIEETTSTEAVRRSSAASHDIPRQT